MWVNIAVTLLAGYLLGNLNGAVITSKLMHDDVRKHGSGNAGLTNFVRNYGTGRALIVILIDACKALLACFLGGLLLKPYGMWHEGAALGGVAVMLGHAYPVLLGFHGGKGILSGMFVGIFLDWRIALLCLILFMVSYLPTMYVSLGSVVASLGFGLGFAIFHHSNPILLCCGIFMSLLAIFLHRENIVRLIKGQERKTNLFKKNKE